MTDVISRLKIKVYIRDREIADLKAKLREVGRLWRIACAASESSAPAAWVAQDAAWNEFDKAMDAIAEEYFDD